MTTFIDNKNQTWLITENSRYGVSVRVPNGNRTPLYITDMQTTFSAKRCINNGGLNSERLAALAAAGK